MPKCLPDHSLSLSAGVHWPFEKQRIFYARKFESDFAPLSVGTIAIRLKKTNARAQCPNSLNIARNVLEIASVLVQKSHAENCSA